MNYSELVVQEYEYTYSVNIQFDLENDTKLARFIPNETTIGLLREFFTDVIKPNSSNNARILYGSYGTGKSHFLTVLSDILGKYHTNSLAFDAFISKINDFDADLANDIKKFIEVNKPFFIVPIVFDFEDFNRCIYFSLRKALDARGIKVNLKSFYTYAYELVEQWSENQSSLSRIEEVCTKNGTTPQKLKDGLLAFDDKYEKLFKSIFSDMTFGVPFIHEASNLSENLDEVNKKICDEYSGIVFIFDEFGRYLEDNIRKIKVKEIQDMAEYCDHSKYNNHIILISHKEISQYTTKYDDELINEWKKVEGRYKAIPIDARYDQCLSLIKYIIPKNENTWHAFKNRYPEELNSLYNEAWDFKGFLTSKDQKENPFEGGYPIHPIALFALDRLSKKVAQNERTFFTFLASKESNSLYEFLQTTETDSFHFLGVDKIYEYFEPNVKSIRSSQEYETYRKLQISISKCESKHPQNDTCYKVLRTIAAINIISDYSVLPANMRILSSVIDEKKEHIEDAINWLVLNKIIKFSRHYGYYEFFDSSIFDIDDMIISKINDISDEMVVKTLNNEFVDFVLYPYEYNETYKIKRMFIPIFTTIDEIGKSSFIKQAPDYYDGVLALVIGNKNIMKEVASTLANKFERVIAIINNSPESLICEVKKYIVIKYFESISHELSQEDPAVVSELKYYREEQIELVKSIIDAWKNIDHQDIILTCDGALIENVSSQYELQGLASKKMYEYFPSTLIVNNELINKNTLTGAMNGARRIAVDKILSQDNEDEYFGLTLLSPEYTCLRSVLAKNGIYEDDNITNFNCLPDGTETTQEVIRVINENISSYKNAPGMFSDLYNVLKKPPFGLRDGYLPILVSYLLRPYRNALIINSHGAEQEITADTFAEMVSRPEDFAISISIWDKEKSDFIDSLEETFNTFIDFSKQKKNRLKALYEAFSSHYKNISKFSRTSDFFVSDRTKQYRKLMGKSVQDYSRFFFIDLKAIGGNYSTTAEAIKTIKSELEILPMKIIRYLVDDIRQVFSIDSNTPLLAASLCHMYKIDWTKKRERSYDFYTNTWLEIMSKISIETKDDEVISSLAKAFTSFDISYWNDQHKEEFVKRLREVKERLDNYVQSPKLEGKDIKITLETADGNTKSVVFENDELDDISMTLKNKMISALNYFGRSVTYEEKIQIILSLLGELMESK